MRSSPSPENPPDLRFTDRRPTWLDWFYDLPLGHKQLLALVICELVPIVGFGLGSTWLLVSSLRMQLMAQAKSEIAVTITQYGLKISQMGFSAQMQAEHPAILSAARSSQRGDKLPQQLRNQVKQILRREVQSQKIEYAILVNKDLQIILNANLNRSKQSITDENLSSLIQQCLNEARQIQASTIIRWEDLSRGGGGVPAGLDNQDALIRYVLTPVKDPTNQEIVGLLVLGDVVNQKPEILEKALATIKGGYGAIYTRYSNGAFALATSLQDYDASQPPKRDEELNDPTILQAAVEARGGIVTDRVQVGERTYTMAAKALPNRTTEIPEGVVPTTTNNPPAILVRGIAEDPLDQVLRAQLHYATLVLLASGVVAIGWHLLWRRLVLHPILALRHTTRNFATGNRTSRTHHPVNDELGQLVTAFNRMADSVFRSEADLAERANLQTRLVREANALRDITGLMRRSPNPDQILQTAIEEIRSFLNVDRVIVYRFSSDSLMGTVVAEAIVNPDISVLGQSIQDFLGLRQFEQYNEKSVWFLHDINTDPINTQYRRNLAQLKVKAEIVTPLKRNHRLVGLLCAQEYFRPRQWQDSEIHFFTQLAVQIGYALEQAQLLQERQSALQEGETFKDTLQQQIIQLLQEVQGASQGDLTLRSSGLSNELGMLSDFLNTVLEHLRQNIAHFHTSIRQVGELLATQELTVQELATTVQQQAQDDILAATAMRQMTQTLQTITSQALQAQREAQTTWSDGQVRESLIDSILVAITHLQSTIHQSGQHVEQLDESSQEMGRIGALVNDLSGKTELLAMNASIEASRLADRSHGFGVVAIGIGELALRSADAMREIERTIGTIQRQIQVIIQSTTLEKQQGIESLSLASHAKQQFALMTNLSAQLNQKLELILSEAAEAQTPSIQTINELMQQSIHNSNQISELSHRSLSNLQHTIVAVTELQSVIETFKVQAEERSNSVNS